MNYHNTFVYRPGGTSHDNIYATWPDLMAALAKAHGHKDVMVDDTFTPGQANVPAGIWNIDNCTFRASYANSNGTLLQFEQDSHVTFTYLQLSGNIEFRSRSTVPVAILTTTASIYIENEAQLLTGLNPPGFAPWLHVTAGATLTRIILMGFAEFGNASDVGPPCALIDAGAVVLLFASNDSYILENSFTGAGEVDAHVAPGTYVGTGQTVATFKVVGARSSRFVFKPGMGGDVNGECPPDVYVDWGTMFDRMSRVPGPKTLEIDTSISAAHVPSGSWDMDDCILSGHQPGTLLTFDQGAVFTFHKLEIKDLTCVSASTVPVAVSTDQFMLRLDNAVIRGALPWLQVSNALGGSLLMINGSTLGDGITPAVTVDLGRTINLTSNNSSIMTSAVTGAGTLNVSDLDNSLLGVQTIFTTLSATSLNLVTPGTLNPAPGLVAGAGAALPATPTTYLQVNIPGLAGGPWYVPLYHS